MGAAEWRDGARSAPSLAAASHRASKPLAAVKPAAAIEIVNPPAGGVYLIDPTLRREFQTLALRAVTPQPTEIEWTVSGQVVGKSSSEQPLEWPLLPGAHRIVARDGRGRVSEVSVVVK